MRKEFLYLMLSLILLTGCVGERVSIQPGEVGKVLSTDGLEEEIKQPGGFRLNTCYITACDRLVRLQTQKTTMLFDMTAVFLPKSNVDITNIQVGIQFRVKDDTNFIEAVFLEVKPVVARTLEQYAEASERDLVITTEMLWETYIQRKAPDAVRTVLRDYSIDEILVQVPEISEVAKKAINEMLKDTPIEVTELGFPNGIGEPPQEVLEAKRKFFAVKEETARSIAFFKAAVAIEEARQEVQKTRVKNDLENAKMAGVGYSEYTLLKIMERFAEEKTPLAIGSMFNPSSFTTQPE